MTDPVQLSRKTEVLPHAGAYDVEEAYNPDTDVWDWRKLKVVCPQCEREFAALCSPLTEQTWSGMRWVGLDYQQPEAEHRTRCRCGYEFRFTTYCSE